MGHPYHRFTNMREWKVIKKCLDDLSKNHDLIISTKEEYVTGYILDNLLKVDSTG